MGGCRCTYKNCKNTTKTTENVHFFHYPVKNKDRCKKWIENANKPEFFELDQDQLRNKVVCEEHFEERCFPNYQKKRLVYNAVPTLDGENCYDYKPEPVRREIPTKRKTTSSFWPVNRGVEDIEVLQANDDATIFVLDTSKTNLPRQVENVETFVFSNDDIVPLDEVVTDEVFPEQKQICLSEANGQVEPQHERSPLTYHTLKSTNTVTLNGKQLLQKAQRQLMGGEVQEIDPLASEESVGVRDEASMVSDASMISDVSLEDMICKTVETKYLNKIKEHSKAITSIKRMLQTNKAPRPSKMAILRYLKPQIPPTLYALLNLSLSNRCVLSQSDVQFFRLIYDTSPALYRSLSQQFHWKMPTVEDLNQMQ